MPVLVPNRQVKILGDAERLILASLLRYGYLSSRQVCRLLFKSGSLTYAQTKLKALSDSGYCQRIWLPKRGPRGSTPAVYTLARRGLNTLQAEGFDTNPRYHPSEKTDLSYLFLTHTLELNDFLIGAELFFRSLPEFELAALVHERELKRNPVYVLDDSRRRTPVIPDAWLDIRIQGTFQVCIVVELDRGTEEQKKWRRKVASLLAFANGPYQERFRTRSLTVAVPTTAGDKRVLELLSWTQAELEARQERSQGDLFLFTNVSPSTIEPAQLFLAPRWFQPFRDAPLALLESGDWAV